jgi:hypothetical protein
MEYANIYDEFDSLLPAMEIWYAFAFALSICFAVLLGIMYMICKGKRSDYDDEDEEYNQPVVFEPKKQRKKRDYEST